MRIIHCQLHLILEFIFAVFGSFNITREQTILHNHIKQFALSFLFYPIFATEEVGQEIQFPSTDDEFKKYYLTIGAKGIKGIELTMPNSSGGCENADGSLFKKGERIWLENLDGYSDLRGLTIAALNKDGEIVWSASVPTMSNSRQQHNKNCSIFSG